MKVVLELQDQPSNIRKVTVRHDIVIGRGADCNLRLSAPQVSRRHCFLRITADSVSVTDLDSSNGTYLNGKRITSGKRYEVQNGSQLAVGPVKFTARVESEQTAADLLKVSVNDERIETEAADVSHAPTTDNAPPDTAVTVPSFAEDDSHADSMNFAVESAGPAAGEDDPTTDFADADNLGDGKYFSDLNDVQQSSEGVEPTAVVDEETVTGTSDGFVAGSGEQFVLQMPDEEDEDVDIIADVEIIEDEEVVLSEEELEFLDEPETQVPDDHHDVLVVDDDEVVVVEDEGNDESVDSDRSGDSVQNELRDFLNGLD